MNSLFLTLWKVNSGSAADTYTPKVAATEEWRRVGEEEVWSPTSPPRAVAPRHISRPLTDLDEEASALGNPLCEDAAINSECLQCNCHSVLPNARGFPHRGVQETTRSTVRSHFFKASPSIRCSSNLR